MGVAHQTTGYQFERAPSVRWSLWALALLSFGVGDLATTLAGLAIPGVTEVGPVAGLLFRAFGIPGVVTLKVGALVGFYAFWRVTPRPYAVGVPLGLVVVGITVTCWNLVVIGVAAPF